MKEAKIAPSLLASDFGTLKSEVEMVNKSEAYWHHLDIMDGVFVPNISYGMPVVQAIAKHATKPLDAHLMIVDPDRYIKTFAELGVHNLTVHYEACTHLHRSIQAIKDEGMTAGVALNPHTSVQLLEDSIEYIDLVLIMSVNPGFGGQSFIDNTYSKIRALRDLITRKGTQTLIEVDGGIAFNNARALVDAGADILVAGSSVFKSDNPSRTIQKLKTLKD